MLSGHRTCRIGPVACVAALLVLVLECGPAAALTPGEIDAYFEARWKAKGLTPSARVEDGLFLRRVWLDLAGVVPRADAVAAFERDPDPAKRTRIVDGLLGSTLFAESWGERLRGLFLVDPLVTSNRQMVRAFDRWLVKNLAQNVAYDRLVSRLITATGTPRENPEVLFVGQHKDSPEALVGRVGKVFLGVQIQCAQCHDHPFEKWTRTDFLGVQAFFARVSTISVPPDALELARNGHADQLRSRMDAVAKHPGERKRTEERLEWLLAARPIPSMSPEELADPVNPNRMMEEPQRVEVLVDRPKGEAMVAPMEAPAGAKKTPVRPAFLDGTSPPWPDDGVNRRQQLAGWLAAGANPYFARAAVNRVWSILLGRGLVEPVDNLVTPDFAAHRSLLDGLAAHFAASGFDLRELIRLVVSTAVYQRSMQPSANNPQDREEFSRGARKPLSPEQLFRSLLAATGFGNQTRFAGPAEYEKLRFRGLDRFSRVFENDGGEDQAETFHGSLTQALFLFNSPELVRALQPAPWTTLRSVLDTGGQDADRIVRLYLIAYSRKPSPQELSVARDFIRSRRGNPGGWWMARVPPREAPAWIDLFWCLLTSAEFLVNH